MLTENDQLRYTLHVIFNINDNIDPKMKIFRFQGELFITMECILVDFVDILRKTNKFLQKFREDNFIQPMLQFLEKLFHTLSFNSISSQLIIKILPIFTNIRH